MTTHRRLELLLAVIFIPAALIFLIRRPELYLVVIVHLFAIPAVLYPAVYTGSPWKQGATGKALMNKARSVALLFGVAVLGYWWPFPGYAQIYALIVTYLGLAVTYQFSVMLRLKKKAREERAPWIQP